MPDTFVEEMLPLLLKTTYTTADLSARIRSLREHWQNRLYHKLPPPSNGESEPDKEDVHLVEALDKFLPKSSDISNMHKMFTTLSIAIKNLPVVVVYLSFTPVPDDSEKLGKWFRENVESHILMDLRVDPSLSIGCAFVWKGRYYDLSLHYYMEKEKTKFLELLEHYK